jgi:hypothetical protein
VSYIGAEPTTAAFPFDQFSGNGTTTAFTLTYAPASTTSIIVAISGVVQNPNLYSVIGTTITFSPAPPTGTNNISVLYLGLPVQIGTPIPGSRLELALGSAANPSLTFLGDTNTGIFSPAADTIAFSEGGVESMRIDSSGRLLVGTTSTSFSTAGVQIYPTGEIDAVASAQATLFLNRLTSDGNIANFYRNGTQVGSISVTGSATAYNTSSDYRLKNTIAPMTGALATVAQLKPVTYNWKADGSNGEGFIAHELAEVVPQCVTGEKDAVDADGNPVYQGIDTSFLVATLTAAIQELKAELDATKAEVALLKGAA